MSDPCYGKCWSQVDCWDFCDCGFYDNCKCADICAKYHVKENDEECDCNCACKHRKGCFVLTKQWEMDHQECDDGGYCSKSECNMNVCCKLYPCQKCNIKLPEWVLHCHNNMCMNCAVEEYAKQHSVM